MKCPYRKSVTVCHKSGDETTVTEWLECYAADCPEYDTRHKTCRRIDKGEPLGLFTPQQKEGEQK